MELSLHAKLNCLKYNCFDICLCVKKVKLATIIEGNPKAPFSIAATPRCRGGRSELFDIKLFACIKMDLALHNLQRLIYHKIQTNKQTNKHYAVIVKQQQKRHR